jgi:hypothetical protein
MNLLDLSRATTAGLRALPYESYLRIMHGICRQYRLIYAAFLLPDADRLVDETERLVAAEAAPADPPRRALYSREELAAQWENFDEFFADDLHVAHEGLSDVYRTIRVLVEELTGRSPRYAAADRCLVPFTEHPDAWRAAGYLAAEIPAEVANSPLVLMIRRLERSVTAQAREIRQVPLARMRDFVFGDIEAVL